jgi:hypothetical protein
VEPRYSSTKKVAAVTESASTLPPETKFIATYMTADATEKAMVENHGVRYRGGTRPRMAGSALWNDIDSVVRAVGRMVVCVVAAAEESTMSRSSRDSTSPTAPLPNTAPPMGESTSVTLLEFPRPMPDEPKPANICTDRMTTK